MSRRSHRHWLDRREPREYHVFAPDGYTLTDETETDDLLIATCGYQKRPAWAGRASNFTSDRQYVDCPACNSKLDKAAMKARAPDAPKLELIQDKVARGTFRHGGGWRALVDGEFVAFIGYEDHAWRVYSLVLDGDKILVGWPKCENGEEKLRSYGSLHGAIRAKSKDAALLEVERLRGLGWLKTEAEIIDEQRREAETYAAKRQERLRKVDVARTNLQETLDALREILADQSLTNFQRQGLMTAIESFEERVRTLR